MELFLFVIGFLFGVALLFLLGYLIGHFTGLDKFYK